MKELNTDRNRNKALEVLESCGITDGEWADLNKIVSLSENLVPLEEEAMEHVKAGDLEAAQDCVFSTEYETSVEQINALTDETVNGIVARKEKNQATLKFLQIIFEILFAGSFMYVVLQFVKTIRFSDKELLQPIIKVSEQMAVVAGGNFHTALALQEDDSEVGRMVSAIAFMKRNLRSMVQ